MDRIKKRLNAEPITRSKQRAVVLVPKHKRKLATQLVEALDAQVFVQMECDLAVRPRSQVVAGAFEFALGGLVVIEFAVNDDVFAAIFAGNRLVAGGQIDDAKPCVTQSYSPIGRNPMSLSVRPAMMEPPRTYAEKGWRSFQTR